MDSPDILKYLKFQKTVRVEAGSDIREFLQENDLLAVLKAGAVELVSARGHTRVALKPGTPLGILRSDPVEAYGKVIAIEACELIPLDEEGVITLIENNPRFTKDLIGVLIETVGDLVRLLP